MDGVVLKKRTKKCVLIAIIAVLAVSLFLCGFASAADYDAATIKVGLNSPLRSSNPQIPYVTLKNSTGFRIGQFNDSREFSETNLLKASSITVTAVSGGFDITDNVSGKTQRFSTSKIAIMPVSATSEGTSYTLPDKSYGTSAAYYGGFEFVRSSTDSKMTVISYVDLEAYVKCVLPYEMPASWHTEALKAQALCIRTYALKHLNGYSQYGFDVCNTTYSQVYGGVYTKDGTSYMSRIDSVVDSTAGECILYGDALIDAVYHAASGGATEDAANVWGGSVPYLKGVADTYEKTPDVYSYSGNFSASEIYSTLKAKISGFPLADISDISCAYTENKNMLSITFTDSAGKTETYYRGDCRTRVMNCFTSYTSQRFSITKELTAGGDRYAISSAGYGHNVGMSQYGAKGMAEAGYTYDKIISYYYTGVTLSSGKTDPEKPDPEKPLFTDVKEGSWYYDAVMFVVDKGLFQGTGASLFSPDTPMTRAMFVTVLGRAGGVNVDSYEPSTVFTDVPPNQFYSRYVAWAVDKGITLGYDDGGFHPNATITREEMCSLLNRFCKLYNITLKTDASLPPFSDSASISGWAAADVDAMRQAKIVSGVGNGGFSPKRPCTRAEVAQVLMNFLSQYKVN